MKITFATRFTRSWVERAKCTASRRGCGASLHCDGKTITTRDGGKSWTHQNGATVLVDEEIAKLLHNKVRSTVERIRAQKRPALSAVSSPSAWACDKGNWSSGARPRF